MHAPWVIVSGRVGKSGTGAKAGRQSQEVSLVTMSVTTDDILKNLEKTFQNLAVLETFFGS